MNKNPFLKICFLVVFFSLLVHYLTAQTNNYSRFLPQPSGSFNVGTTNLFITDSSRKERFKKNDYRRIYVRIWYPADIDKNLKPELYLQNYSSELINSIFMSKDFSYEWLEEIKKTYTFSYRDARLDTSQSTYPVIIFTPGYYFGMDDLYSAYMEEFASHGYIVCCINHPYEQPFIEFPDQKIYIKKKRTQWAYLQLVIANWFHFRKTDSHDKVVKTTRYYHKMLHRFRKALDYWVEDTRFFIDYLYSENGNEILSSANLNQIAALGQSFGGAVTGQLCLLDDRVKAGINLDCFQFGDVIDKPLQQPFLLIQSDYQPTWNLGNTINYENTDGDFSLLALKNASHFVFSDGAVLPYRTEKFKNRMIGEVDGPLLLKTTNEYILDFFDHYILKKSFKLVQENKKNAILEYHFRKGH